MVAGYDHCGDPIDADGNPIMPWDVGGSDDDDEFESPVKSKPSPAPDKPKDIFEELKRRAYALFHRRESTPLSNKDATQLRKIAKREGALEEMAAIERLANSGYEYRRKALTTFLNNWETELDRANNDNRSNKYGSYGRYVPHN